MTADRPPPDWSRRIVATATLTADGGTRFVVTTENADGVEAFTSHELAGWLRGLAGLIDDRSANRAGNVIQDLGQLGDGVHDWRPRP